MPKVRRAIERYGIAITPKRSARASAVSTPHSAMPNTGRASRRRAPRYESELCCCFRHRAPTARPQARERRLLAGWAWTYSRNARLMRVW
jgi:hypothetical protein